MVKGNRADGVEPAQVVLVRVVVTVPRDDVEGGMRLFGLVQGIVELGRDGVDVGAIVAHAAVVFAEARHRGLEVARVGEAVGSDRPQLGQLEVALVELQCVTPDGPGGQKHLVPHAARDDGDFHGPD